MAFSGGRPFRLLTQGEGRAPRLPPVRQLAAEARCALRREPIRSGRKPTRSRPGRGPTRRGANPRIRTKRQRPTFSDHRNLTLSPPGGTWRFQKLRASNLGLGAASVPRLPSGGGGPPRLQRNASKGEMQGSRTETDRERRSGKAAAEERRRKHEAAVCGSPQGASVLPRRLRPGGRNRFRKPAPALRRSPLGRTGRRARRIDLLREGKMQGSAAFRLILEVQGQRCREIDWRSSNIARCRSSAASAARCTEACRS